MNAYREVSPIKYVVVVGGDSVIPFFRYPDPAAARQRDDVLAAREGRRASQASLRLGYVLNQDGYGSTDELSLHGNAFPVPDLPVGRLVETPTEIVGMLDAYAELTERRRSDTDVVARDRLRLPAGCRRRCRRRISARHRRYGQRRR